MIRHLSLALAAALAAVTTIGAQSYVPERVYDSRRREFSDFEAMLAQLTRADVVFVGEQHDDPNTHRLERALLEGLARRQADVVVSLEMFERDVAETLDHFVQGHIEAQDLIDNARTWPRYQTDYKPLVDFAIEKRWPVVAANVPRPIAAEVAKGGLEVLASKTPEERRLFAADLDCRPRGDYFERFVEAMGSHPGSDAASAARYYASQCLKDETMAESIARVVSDDRARGARRVVVHVNGAFHSDFGQGTVERTRRRLRDARIVVISILPVADLDAVSPGGNERRRGAYLVYTVGKS